MYEIFATSRIVKFNSRRNRILAGVLYSNSDNPEKVIIHVHGSYGNFYNNSFIHVFAERLNKLNIAVLSFNLTCHDGFSEGFFTNGDFEYVGGAVSVFDESEIDIGGAIDFINSLYKNAEIILQGHSLGCDRIIQYLVKSEEKYRFSLFSPCDSYELYKRWLKNEDVKKNINRISKKYNCGEWLEESEYGINNNGEEYILPIKKETFISIVTGAPFYYLNYMLDPPFYIESKCFICLCGNDQLQTYSSEEWFSYLKKHFYNSSEYYFENADHDLIPCYNEIYEMYQKWILEHL